MGTLNAAKVRFGYMIHDFPPALSWSKNKKFMYLALLKIVNPLRPNGLGHCFRGHLARGNVVALLKSTGFAANLPGATKRPGRWFARRSRSSSRGVCRRSDIDFFPVIGERMVEAGTSAQQEIFLTRGAAELPVCVPS